MSKSKVQAAGLGPPDASLLGLKTATLLLSFHVTMCPLCAQVSLMLPPFELGPHPNGLILSSSPL